MSRAKRFFKFSFLFIIPAVLILISQPSCKKDNLEDLLKDQSTNTDSTVCDTSFTISYQNDLVPTLSLNCYSCHDVNNFQVAAAGIRLDTYSDLMVKVNDGKLLCAINHELGCTPMPLGGGKLSDCFILRVEAWVDQGSNNN